MTKRDDQAKSYRLEALWRPLSKSLPDYQQDVFVRDEGFHVFQAICNMFGHEPEFIYYPNHKPPEGYTPTHWSPVRRAENA